MKKNAKFVDEDLSDPNDVDFDCKTLKHNPDHLIFNTRKDDY